MDQSNPRNYLRDESQYFESIEGYFARSSGNLSEKLHAFTRFVPRQALSYFLARNTVYQLILGVHGSVLDFGLYRGSSFFTWQQLAAIYEPYNHIRKVIGFDSFRGFSPLDPRDVGADGGDLPLKRAGGMAYDGHSEIREGVQLLDLNRPLGHVPRATIVEGELPATCTHYLEAHQETIVALANFGLGLYQPTVEILRLIKPRLVIGSVLCFEDLNQATWPGETHALFEVFGDRRFQLNRVPYCPHLSWVQIGS